MKREVLPRNKNLNQRARELRNNATPEEKKLWTEFLSAYPVQFNRQRIIGNYIADFYCHRGRLVIEIDGGHHFGVEAQEYDRIRTEYLNALGIEVLRFTNSEVQERLSVVCGKIDSVVQFRLKSLSSPL